MIKHFEIQVNKHALKNTLTIFSFVLYNTIKHTINCGFIIVLIMFEISVAIFSHHLMLWVPFICFLIYFLVAIEETYHILMIISLNKKDTITHIDVTKVKIGFVSFIGGVCVCYQGLFKKSDLFYVSLAGPIMSLIYLFLLLIILIVFQLFVPFDISRFIKVLICSSCAPLSALIPIKTKGYISDGYRIATFICMYNISISKLFSAILYTIKNMTYSTFRSNK